MTVKMIDPLATSCARCAGCGRIANSTDGEPWKYWANLPPGSDLAVRLGFVRPIPCPDCGGSGRAATQKETP